MPTYIRGAYRLIEVKNNKPLTLFHGLNGKRELPVNQWVTATVKPVTDGSSTKVYDSGFNVCFTKEEMIKYAGRFTRQREIRIIPILVNLPTRRKAHSKSSVYLADEMYIPANWFALSTLISIKTKE